MRQPFYHTSLIACLKGPETISCFKKRNITDAGFVSAFCLCKSNTQSQKVNGNQQAVSSIPSQSQLIQRQPADTAFLPRSLPGNCRDSCILWLFPQKLLNVCYLLQFQSHPMFIFNSGLRFNLSCHFPDNRNYLSKSFVNL